MKKQVIVIHGGEVFKTYKEYLSYLKKYELDFERLVKVGHHKGWKDGLSKKLGSDFEVILMKMPNASNARYAEWKIMFQKLLPFIKNKPILIGHSLGGIFLAKYLSENKFPKKILATILVSAPYDDKNTKKEYSLADFNLPKSLKRFQNQGGKIFIYHSMDDQVVPFSDSKKYKKSLPLAEVVEFQDKGHFNQDTFSQVVLHIKKLSSKN